MNGYVRKHPAMTDVEPTVESGLVARHEAQVEALVTAQRRTLGELQRCRPATFDPSTSSAPRRSLEFSAPLVDNTQCALTQAVFDNRARELIISRELQATQLEVQRAIAARQARICAMTMKKTR